MVFERIKMSGVSGESLVMVGFFFQAIFMSDKYMEKVEDTLIFGFSVNCGRSAMIERI